MPTILTPTNVNSGAPSLGVVSSPNPANMVNTHAGNGTAKDKKKHKKHKGGGGSDGKSGGGPSVVDAALQHELDAAVQLRYGDETNSIKRQQAGTPGWFDQYRGALTQARAATAGLYNVGNGTPVGGAIPEVTDPTNLDQQAAANRGALSNAFSGLMQQQGAARASEYDSRSANSNVMEAGQLEALGHDMRNLNKEKGAFKIDFLRDRKEADRQYGLEQSALGVDMAKIDADATEEAGTVNRWGYTNHEWRDMSAGQREQIIANQQSYGKSPSQKYVYGVPAEEFYGLSRAKQLKLKAEWEHAGDAGPSSNGKFYGLTKSQRRANDNQFTHGLKGLRSEGAGLDFEGLTASESQGGYGVDADIAEALIYWRDHGAHLTPQLRKRLHRLGIHFRDDGFKGVIHPSSTDDGYGNHG